VYPEAFERGQYLLEPSPQGHEACDSQMAKRERGLYPKVDTE